MLEADGTVVSFDGDVIWVETEARSACSQCGAGSCSTSVIAKLFGLRRNQLRMHNSLGARVGQHVVIGIPDSALVTASVHAYLIPPLGMIAAAALAAWINIGELAQGVMALFGLLAGMSLVGRMSASQRARTRYAPCLLRVGGTTEITLDSLELSRSK